MKPAHISLTINITYLSTFVYYYCNIYVFIAVISNLFHIIVLLFLCQSQIAQKFLAKIVFAVQIDKMY